jgi:hypothetical protein
MTGRLSVQHVEVLVQANVHRGPVGSGDGHAVDNTALAGLLIDLARGAAGHCPAWPPRAPDLPRTRGQMLRLSCGVPEHKGGRQRRLVADHAEGTVTLVSVGDLGGFVG